MIDIYEPHPNLICGICDDNDHCLPRWEDDGGGIDRPPLAQAFEEGSERDHEHHERPPDGHRHQRLRGPEGGRRGGDEPVGPLLQSHELRHRS
jgi:hypothetical protein